VPPHGISGFGPRRARSIESYLRQTRVAAIVALAILLGFGISDFTSPSFWEAHVLLTGLTASLVVVALSAAVLDGVLERRRRQRWSILAQYVMFELVRNARMTWTGILDAARLLPSLPNQQDSLDGGAELIRDTPALVAALRARAEDDDVRGALHAEIAFLADHADGVLGRWAAVMLNAEVYAEVLDRHVELAGDITWIAGVLDNFHPPHDPRRRSRARSSPSVQIEPGRDGEWLVDRLVVITQLAEELDRATLDLALRIVPVQWWEARLGTTAPADPGG
jgi:hypothetical protein